MVFPLNVVADEQHAKVRTADTSFSDRHAAHVKDASQAGSVYRLGRPFLKLWDAGDPAVSYSAFASRRAGGPPSALNVERQTTAFERSEPGLSTHWRHPASTRADVLAGPVHHRGTESTEE